MANREVEITPLFFDTNIPETTLPGYLYISKEYKGCVHLCLCGCGTKCFLPLGENEWQLIIESENVISLTPSILQRFKCKSHYIITKNKANFI